MKAKRKGWRITGIALLLLALLAVWRYHQINRHPHCLGVTQEILIHKNEVVRTSHVDFTIHQALFKKDKNQIKATIKLTIRQIGPAAYGQKKENPNFLENMWLNIPYSFSTQADPEQVFDKNHRHIQRLSQLLYAKQPITLRYVTKTEFFNERDQKIRFSFLVPIKNHYIKYSLPLE